jgi:very-short-patch-repair endonuclease
MPRTRRSTRTARLGVRVLHCLESPARRRWIDVAWDERKAVVETGAAQHTDPPQRWDDVRRDNGLRIDGYQPLRFPAWLVRQNPEHVAREILKRSARPVTGASGDEAHRVMCQAWVRYACGWYGAVAQQVRAADS